MFERATAELRKSLYGIWARTREGDTMHHSTGTGFMIAPGFIVTNSHVLRRRGEDTVHDELLARATPAQVPSTAHEATTCRSAHPSTPNARR